MEDGFMELFQYGSIFSRDSSEEIKRINIQKMSKFTKNFM